MFHVEKASRVTVWRQQLVTLITLNKTAENNSYVSTYQNSVTKGYSLSGSLLEI